MELLTSDQRLSWDVALDRIARKDYVNDPVAWVRDKLGEHVWSRQAEIMHAVSDNRLVAVQSAHGVGKVLGADYPVRTDVGWKVARDLTCGDVVHDHLGRPTTITGISPTWTRPGYRITFDDGATITAGAEHLWNVLDLTKRARHVQIHDWRNHWDRTVTYETQELFKLGLKTPHGQNRWRIPLAGALQAPTADLPLDPYLLGFWLADGSRSRPTIVIGDTKLGLLAWLDQRGYDYSVRDQVTVTGRAKVVSLRGMLSAFRAVGVLGRKRIPWAYQNASEAQRRELLAGIMDGDGFRRGQGHAEVGIGWCDPDLAEDLHELLIGLGNKVCRREDPANYVKDGVRHDTGTCHRFTWRPLENPFKIRNQEWVDTPAQRSRHTIRTIVDIEPVEPVTNFCIQVDNPAGLYLAGRDLIPTHNSHLASRLCAWWIDTHPPDQTLVVTSAPSAHQVVSVLWRYIRHAQIKGQTPGYITQGQVPEWKIDSNLVGFGRRPADHSKSSFQGFHAKYLLVVLDEAGGIPKWLWDAADSLMSGETGQHLLAIGNPDDNSAHFYKVCTTEANWVRYRISAFDSPNYTGEDVPPELAELLVGPAYVEDKRARWGVNSALWKVKVEGEFVDSEDGLIPLSWVRQANHRWNLWRDSGSPEIAGRRVIGVDVARYGEDSTVLAIREGDVIRELKISHREETTQTTSRVVAELEHPASMAVVDVLNMGAGVVDQLRAQRKSVIAYNASMATRRRDSSGMWRFPNCLTGEAVVEPVGRLRRIYRARYEGPLYRVHMASGDHFTATANHQVLGRLGWQAVQSLNVGDELLHAERSHGTSGIDPEVDGMPATIGEVYETMRARRGAQRMAAGSVNFHGDIPVGEVEVVTVNGDLDAIHPPLGEDVEKSHLRRLLHGPRPLFGLSALDETLRPARTHLFEGPSSRPQLSPAGGSLAVAFGGDTGGEQPVGLHVTADLFAGFPDDACNGTRAADGSGGFASPVSGKDLSGVLVGAERLDAPAWLDVVFGQNAADNTPAHPELVSQRVQRLLGGVPLDQVVDIEIIPSGGHESSWVYTVETSTGAYRTQSTVHRNCRDAGWWNLRELLDPALGATIALPDDEELTAELTSPTFTVGAGNTYKVESKDEIRKRLGRSTDRADAVVQAFWQSPSTGRMERDELGERVPRRRPRAINRSDAPSW